MRGLGKINNGRERGLTLIEVMISLAILIIAVGGMAAAFQNSIYQNVSAKNQSQAAIIAQSVLAELSATDPSMWDFTTLQDSFHFDFEGKRVPANDADAYYSVEISKEAFPGWDQVTIGVNWAGWETEASKGGSFGGTSPTFGYVLEAVLSDQNGN